MKYMYMYIISTPNSGLDIAVSVWEREQGRFRGNTEGARGGTIQLELAIGELRVKELPL